MEGFFCQMPTKHSPALEAFRQAVGVADRIHGYLKYLILLFYQHYPICQLDT